MILIGNWKMSPDSLLNATSLAKKTNNIAKSYKKILTLVICPPFIHIPQISKQVKINIGGQTTSSETSIAQTGLISATMLKSYGAKYCIVGHSESRARGESNESTKKQIANLLEKNIKPILCVGEKDRDSHGWYLSSVKEQIEVALSGVVKNSLKNIIIAYEPVWAIGSNAIREATPTECEEMIIFIRKILSDMYGEKISNSVSVLYGGSVDEKNAINFVTSGKADGLLVGRVSLDPKRFGDIAKSIAIKK
jgi:triosephosphate isomerase